jgi:nucleoid-associated protein YgaU
VTLTDRVNPASGGLNRVYSGTLLHALPGEITTHVVSSGDTLESVAKQYYGDGSKWTQLFTANRGLLGQISTRLQPGQMLTIPNA